MSVFGAEEEEESAVLGPVLERPTSEWIIKLSINLKTA